MQLLSIQQARRQSLWLNVLGWAVFLICAALLGVALLKGIHTAAATATTPAEVALLGGFARAVEALVSIPARVAPGVTAFIWHAAPNLNLRGPILSADNAGCFAVYLLMLLSLIPRGRAVRLRRAIAEHDRRMQQIYWEEAARAALRKAVPLGEIERKLDVKVSIEHQKAPWHTTLIGVVVLGIGLPLIVEVLKVVVGLAKLP